jgi:hypothetical protein
MHQHWRQPGSANSQHDDGLGEGGTIIYTLVRVVPHLDPNLHTTSSFSNQCQAKLLHCQCAYPAGHPRNYASSMGLCMRSSISTSYPCSRLHVRQFGRNMLATCSCAAFVTAIGDIYIMPIPFPHITWVTHNCVAVLITTSYSNELELPYALYGCWTCGLYCCGFCRGRPSCATSSCISASCSPAP